MENMKIINSRKVLEAAVYGGAFLGGGGGGSIEEGMRLGEVALEIGNIVLTSPSELERKGIVVTASTVGSQIKGKGVLKPFNYIEAARIIEKEIGKLAGLISSENGGLNTIAAWIQAAALGLPVVDAPCDGRAHPTILMGSMGLHRLKNYVSVQSFSVGSPAVNHVSGVIKGPLLECSKVIRSIASIYGAVAVTRNPVTVDYLLRNAAVGAVSLAIEIGEVLLKHFSEPLEALHKLASRFSGRFFEKCTIESLELETKGGFDVGKAVLKCGSKSYELTYMNEFMTLENSKGERVATFPDLITLVDVEGAKPILSAELKRNMEVHMVVIDKTQIPLGSGLKYREVYSILESALGKPITTYISTILVR